MLTTCYASSATLQHNCLILYSIADSQILMTDEKFEVAELGTCVFYKVVSLNTGL